MRRLKFLTAVLLLLAPAAAVCQESEPAPGAQDQCPRIEVTQPTVMLEQGTPMTFSAGVSGGDPRAQFTFNWTVSAGTIIAGQGTPSITIDTTGLGGQIVTVTVEVGGLPEPCAKSEVRQVRVEAPTIGCNLPFDSYAWELKFNDEKARLDNFAIAIQMEPAAKGYILIYAGERARPDAVKRKLKRARSYLTNHRGVDAESVVLVYGGYAEHGAEDGVTLLQIVSRGAKFPFPGEIIK